ncbi:MAG TPA: response regulator transcription factor [Coriobacteriia bacterium]|nr:response regulator transcription factor [Coriobacteriia bacterium]
MPDILVVDDNEKIVEVLAEYLKSAGYGTFTAADGPSALALAESQRPDLALVDVMLPGIDGLELTKRFEALGIPVILVTARTEEVDRLVGLELGADDYITKPFSPREVVARVKAVLRRCARAQGIEEVVRVGELILDHGRRTVMLGGEEIDLTRTEFDILATMAGHPGRVYSRLQLMEAASGEAYEGYERTIDAHVKNIRRKLGEDPKQPRYVHTVFGVGYKVQP